MIGKLDDRLTGPEAYWLILNNLLSRKTSNIPPLIVTDSVVLDFPAKANLFSNFFVLQCSHMVNSSFLPNFSYKTQNRISELEVKEDDILLIIDTLSLNKAHGWIRFPFV